MNLDQIQTIEEILVDQGIPINRNGSSEKIQIENMADKDFQVCHTKVVVDDSNIINNVTSIPYRTRCNPFICMMDTDNISTALEDAYKSNLDRTCHVQAMNLDQIQTIEEILVDQGIPINCKSSPEKIQIEKIADEVFQVCHTKVEEELSDDKENEIIVIEGEFVDYMNVLNVSTTSYGNRHNPFTCFNSENVSLSNEVHMKESDKKWNAQVADDKKLCTELKETGLNYEKNNSSACHDSSTNKSLFTYNDSNRVACKVTSTDVSLFNESRKESTSPTAQKNQSSVKKIKQISLITDTPDQPFESIEVITFRRIGPTPRQKKSLHLHRPLHRQVSFCKITLPHLSSLTLKTNNLSKNKGRNA